MQHSSLSSHPTIRHPSLAMGVFYSPPEAANPDSFESDSLDRHLASDQCSDREGLRLPPIRSMLVPLSPPVSPDSKPDGQPSEHREKVEVLVQDPQLYPDKANAHAGQAQPLFRVTDLPPRPQRRSRTFSSSAFKAPVRIDSSVTFAANVLHRIKADPQAYIRKELEFLSAYPARFPAKRVSNKKGADAVDARIHKRPRPTTRPAFEKLPAVKRAARPPLRAISVDNFAAPETAPTKHKRKVSRTTPTPREDMDYRKVTDYAPAIATIPVGRALKIDWKGHPLDLADDPDRHMLSDQELHLASILRLSGAQYLFAKRKIFERFIELAKVGKEFNKTSAQAVCKIDVNKASKLWTAFEKVGWFDQRLFVKYL